ncbi:MAG TPA: hypothetical protein VLA04_04000 [Verrucomicrobiae bacterium]|nr:hypothetical protein [Verrucomicrobiae bacterium]
MRRKRITYRVFLALLAAALWLGFLVEGSHALYTDQVQLTGNSVVSGTANLLISNSQNPSSSLFEKSRAGFTSDLSPGESFEKFFFLKNASDGNVDFKIYITTAIPGGSTPLTSAIFLSFVEVDSEGNPIGQEFRTSVSAGQSMVQDSGFVVPKGSTHRYRLATSLDSTYAQQGQAGQYDIIFTGNQVLN